jgi:hypothetical protein
MTFLEAAIEILRSAEEPLHFNDIARLAVERKLLSHVGRDPEAAMRTCLNSAMRSGVHDGLLVRDKPGVYRLREGASLPTLPPAPAQAEPLPDAEHDERDEQDSHREKPNQSRAKAQAVSKPGKDLPRPSERSRRGRSGQRDQSPRREPPARREAPAQLDLVDNRADGEAEEAESDEDRDEDRDDGREDAEAEAVEVGGAASKPIVPNPELDPNKVRFRGPEGSGLEGDTDVALVMANAMSRLVEERPELREELEAMQKPQTSAPEVIEVGRKKRPSRGGGDDEHAQARAADRDDDRGGRRRRRRRRRGKRVEWSESGGGRGEHTRGEELLDRVAQALSEAGSRSLHVRQIAESLAAQDVLGGEISEIERAVTAAILLDVHRRGDGSRFAVRGDARYQLRGSRLPDKAAAAEHAVRAAAHRLEAETEAQLLLWLQSLGARSLESLVRIWLAGEGFSLVATLPPARGLGKLVVEDPDPEEEDGRTLVLIVPRKTPLDPKSWEGEAERNGCSNTLVFAMNDNGGEAPGDARTVAVRELASWMLRRGIGVRTMTVQIPVLDADLIESIGGLDT